VVSEPIPLPVRPALPIDMTTTVRLRRGHHLSEKELGYFWENEPSTWAIFGSNSVEELGYLSLLIDYI